MPQHNQDTLRRFITACQENERILAAFIGGSYASGDTDQFSDLDLFFITTDEAYADFVVERESFIRKLGEPLFLEDFGLSHGYLVIYANGSEADIFFGREGSYKDIYSGPYLTLLDKTSILNGEVFPPRNVDLDERIELLRRQVDWFWHDLSHFIKAMGRKELWFAYGELEIIRSVCVNLARLRYNFNDTYLKDEPYFKVEHLLPVDQLAPLEKTVCPLEYHAMLEAAQTIFHYYQAVAPTLAKEHGLPYQDGLERMMEARLDKLAAIS